MVMREPWLVTLLLGMAVMLQGGAGRSSTPSLKVTLPSHKERTILSIRLQELLDRKSSTAPGGDNGRSATQAGDGDEDDGAEECYLPPRTSAEARCSIIQSKPVCGEIRALVDYLEVIYCRMGSSWGRAGAVAGTVLLLLWLLLLMSMMGSTADCFFVPPLTLLSDYLQLSPAVAGCTLLAFGNGAPDIFTAHAAIGSQDDLPLVLSALLGAALLVITAVLASIILIHKGPITGVSRSSMLRDVIFYLCIVATTIAMCYDGVITLWESSAFIGAYVLYILSIVAKQRKHIRKTRKAATKALPVVAGENYRIPFLLEFTTVDTESSESEVDDYPVLMASQHGRASVGSRKRKGSDSGVQEGDEQEELLLSVGARAEEAALPGLELGDGVLENVQVLVEYPFTLLRHLTTPLMDRSWGPRRRLLACAWPVPFAALVTISGWGVDGLWLAMHPSCPLPVWAGILTAGPLVSAACFLATRGNRRPQGWLRGMLAMVAFLSAMLWMNLLAGEIVAVVESFGAILNISSGVLGVTVLAMSNSLGDWFSNVAVARKGHGAMSVAACFGAPVLNDLLGIGISLTAYCIRARTGYQVSISDESYDQVKLIWSFLLPTLVITLVVFPMTKFSPGRSYAIFLLVVYAAFILMAVLTELQIIRLPW